MPLRWHRQLRNQCLRRCILRRGMRLAGQARLFAVRACLQLRFPRARVSTSLMSQRYQRIDALRHKIHVSSHRLADFHGERNRGQLRALRPNSAITSARNTTRDAPPPLRRPVAQGSRITRRILLAASMVATALARGALEHLHDGRKIVAIVGMLILDDTQEHAHRTCVHIQ
jgi:hypothetical protein